MENLFKNTFLLDEQTGFIPEISEESKKTVANRSDKIFK